MSIIPGGGGSLTREERTQTFKELRNVVGPCIKSKKKSRGKVDRSRTREGVSNIRLHSQSHGAPSVNLT